MRSGLPTSRLLAIALNGLNRAREDFAGSLSPSREVLAREALLIEGVQEALIEGVQEAD